MECLNETTVALFVERRLAAEHVSEIEAHIDGCTACRALLSGLGRDRDSASTLGRYVVRRTIGTGGMGTIYEAHDPVLDREIALKLLRQNRAGDAEQRTRLIHEARAMARVRSPNVVAVYDVGTVDDDVYVAMELFTGGTLRSWLAERPRGWREVVDVFAAAGRGLAAAHECGLVHRDFKPENVLIDRGRVSVADFGLAALRGTQARTGAAVDDLVSISDAIVGTPAYMAPEQLAGEAVDARSDQFSFCVALHEALHGERPFAGDTLATLREEVRAGRIRPARRRVPAWLTAAIARGLAVVPADRHPSMPALLARLERGRARRRIAIAVAGGLALAAGGLVLGARYLAADVDCAADPVAQVYDAGAIRHGLATFPDGPATADHVLARLEAWRGEAGVLRAETCRASRVAGTESPQLADLRNECIADTARHVTSLATALARPTTDLAATAVAAAEHATDLTPCRAKRVALEPSRPPDGAIARARYDALQTRISIADIARQAGRGRDAATLGAAVARDAAGEFPSIEANAWLIVGEAQDAAEEYVPAREALQRALVAAETAADDRARIRSYLALASIERSLDRDADAARLLEQAHALVARVGDDRLRLELATTDGSLAAARKDYAAAAAAFESAIQVFGARETLDLAQVLESHASAIALLGRAEEANAEMKRAIAIRERLVGPRSPALIRSFTAIGLQMAMAGRIPDGIALLQRAFELAETAPGYGYSQLPETVEPLAILLAQLGRGSEAMPYLDRAREPIVRTFGEHSLTYAQYLQARSRMQRQVESPKAAIADARAALAIVRELAADAERRGESRAHAAQQLATALEELGQAQRWGDDPKGGIATFTEALALAPQIAHHDWFDAEAGLAECDAMLDDHLADAIPHFERAIELRRSPGFDPVEVANAKTNLAQVLFALHRDRPRVLALLHEARDAYKASPYADVELQQVTEILKTVEKP